MSFRNEQFVEKSSRLSDPINKINLQQFSPDAKEEVPPQQFSDIRVKDLSDLQRNVDVARERERGISLVQVMEHDLLTTNILFDGDYTSKPDDILFDGDYTSKPDDKSVFVQELEKHFEKRELNFDNKSDLQIALLVNFMTMILRMSLSELADLKNCLQQHWGRSNPTANFKNCTRYLIATLRTRLK